MCIYGGKRGGVEKEEEKEEREKEALTIRPRPPPPSDWICVGMRMGWQPRRLATQEKKAPVSAPDSVSLTHGVHGNEKESVYIKGGKPAAGVWSMERGGGIKYLFFGSVRAW